MKTKEVKFSDVPYGSVFMLGSIKWLKLQDVLPSGIPITYRSFNTETNQQIHQRNFNAVELSTGIPGSVPLWRLCQIIKRG